jgi:hypothetical protein
MVEEQGTRTGGQSKYSHKNIPTENNIDATMKY